MSRLLVARTDRLGDVLLSLPVLEYLRAELPDHSIDFLCKRELHGLLEPFAFRTGVNLVVNPNWSGLDAALLLFASGGDFFRAWKAGVPKRFGVRSKWPSWLWLNRGVVQRRSEGTRSEALYNLDLAKNLVRELKGSAREPGDLHILLPAEPVTQAAADAALEGVSGPYVLVHPGMGGSALNLSAEGYAKLLEKWPKANVVLTSGPSPLDEPIVSALQKLVPRAKRLPQVELPVLKELFRRAELVIAPSTGPLHLAHYVGAPTLGVFSPVQAQRPQRWAPWGGAGKSRILSPSHACPGTRSCLGERCDRYQCLDRLVREALPSDWADGLMRST